MAKLVGEKEAIEAENKQLKDRLKETLDTLVCGSYTPWLLQR